MRLNEIYETGYSKIREKFAEEQDAFLKIIAEARCMPLSWLQAAKGVFIPNNEFMLEMFGAGILEFDCYRDGICVWDNALIFPVRGVNGCVAGLAGFYPFIYVDDETDANYYSYSSQDVFQKGKYLYFPAGNLMQAVEQEYLIIVDGLFDAISLNGAGFIAASLMGSMVTPEILMQLRFVKHVILIADNDSAGYKLYNSLSKHLNNITLFKHGKTKDADESLKGEYATEFTRELHETLCELGIESTFHSIS